MTTGPQETQRQPVPREDGGELATALAFLDFARACVIKKAADLSADDVRRPVVPSGTSIQRLIAHLTDGERYWFGVQLLGVGDEPDWNAVADDDRPFDQVLAAYREAIAASNDAVRHLGDPDALAARPTDGVRLSLRWTLAHMTSETARHAGHADLVRELIDGVTGR